MTTYEKTRDLQEIARRINEKKDTPKAGYFDKAAQPRVYLSGIGYNTKKMQTKVWLQIEGDRIVPHCRVICDSQPRSWTESQENEILDTLRAGRLVRWLNRFHVAPTGDQLAEVEQVMKDETLLDTVYGVIPEWREVRVPINRFGKLATRNRLFLVLWAGPKINAPRRFEEISKSMFDVASKKWTRGYPGTPCGYKMCDPGPQAEAIAEVLGRLAAEVVDVERATTHN